MIQLLWKFQINYNKKINSLWNHLIKNPEYLKLYSYVLKDYQQFGHTVEGDESKDKNG